MAISAVQVLSELAREEGAPCMPTLSTAPRPSSPQVLSQLAGEEGFFLMVEGSKIDKAAHPNDPGANLSGSPLIASPIPTTPLPIQ